MVKVKARRLPATDIPVLFLDMSSANTLPLLKAYYRKRVEPHSIQIFYDHVHLELSKNTLYYMKGSMSLSLELLEDVKRHGVPCKAIVQLPLSLGDSAEYFMRIGADCIICEDNNEEIWSKKLYTSLQNPSYLDPQFQRDFLNKIKALSNPEYTSPINRIEFFPEKARELLTEAEIRVFERLSEGKNNRKIAAEAFLAVATVNNHLSNIMRKMQATNRTHMIKRAIELGWIKLFPSNQ